MKLVINRSYTYILPMLDWWDKRVLINSQLRGVFIGDENHPELDMHIFLLYKFTGERWFTMLEQTLQDSNEFVTTYEPDRQHVMFVYDVPIKFQKSYDKFKNSKYSEIDERLKKRIVEFHGEKQTEKIVAVMYKHESMYLAWEEKINEGLPRIQHIKIDRNQEATTSLDMKLEVFNNPLLDTKGKAIKLNTKFLEEKGDNDGN